TLAEVGPDFNEGRTMETVAPVIDIAPFSWGDAAQKAAVAQQFGAACEQTGFLIVTGHGVADETIARMLAAWRGYFDLPEDVKRRTIPLVENGPGYRPVASTSLARTLDAVAPGDLNEGYLISPLLGYRSLPHDYVDGEEGAKWFRVNLWPEAPDDFQG